jgi:hypothetical protein
MEQQGNEFVITRDSCIEWEALLHQQKLYDQHGRESSQRFTLKIKEPTKLLGHFISIAVPRIKRGTLVLYPKWLYATIIVGKPAKDFYNGDEATKKDIQTFVLGANLGVKPLPWVEVTRDNVIKTLKNLLSKYRQYLARATHEEDVQKFISINPFILNPAARIHPKYRLGKEYVCDFIIEDRLAPDFKHIFVEIEAVATELFHKSKERETEFKAEVHHALSQLRNWEIWTRDHISYLKQEFPEFDQAGFVLVIGSNTNLSLAQRRVIMAKNAETGNCTILTYDDLADRLEELINSLSELTASSS